MKTLQQIIDLLKTYRFENEAGILNYCSEFMELQVMGVIESLKNNLTWLKYDRFDLNENYYVVIYGKEFEDTAYRGIAPINISLTGYDASTNLGWGIICKETGDKILVEIKQKMGKDDPSSNKAALLNEANILDALRKEWTDEEFEIRVIKSYPLEKLVNSYTNLSSQSVQDGVNSVKTKQNHRHLI